MKKILRINLHYRRVALRLIVLAFVVGVQPWLWGAVKTKANAIHAKRSEALQLATLQTRVEQIKQGNVTTGNFQDQLTAVAPTTTALSQVIERLERLASDQQTQLEILNIADVTIPEGEVVPVSIKPVRIAIQVRGRAEQLLGIIDRIENIQEIAVIEQWSLNPAALQPVASPLPGEHLYALTAQVLFFLQDDTYAN